MNNRLINKNKTIHESNIKLELGRLDSKDSTGTYKRRIRLDTTGKRHGKSKLCTSVSQLD